MSNLHAYLLGLGTLPYLLLILSFIYSVAEFIYDSNVDAHGSFKETATPNHFRIRLHSIYVSFDKVRVYSLTFPWYWQGSSPWWSWVGRLLLLPVAIVVIPLVVF